MEIATSNQISHQGNCCWGKHGISKEESLSENKNGSPITRAQQPICQMDLLVPALDFIFSGMTKKDLYLSVSIWLWPLVHRGVMVVYTLLRTFFLVVVYAAYNVLLTSKAKQRKWNRSYAECLFWQLSLINCFKNTYFYYVQLVAVSIAGKKPQTQHLLQSLVHPVLSGLFGFFLPVVYTQQILIMMSCIY